MDKIRKDIRIKINLFQQLKIRRNNTEISHNVQYSGRNSQNYLDLCARIFPECRIFHHLPQSFWGP
jgi:hypothetical protein